MSEWEIVGICMAVFSGGLIVGFLIGVKVGMWT